MTNELQRTSAGRLPKLTLRVCNVNLLSHAAVGVASQATVQTYISMGNKILRFANAKYHSFLLFFYNINKGDLPFMNSLVFGVNSSMQSVFLAVVCVTPATLFVLL